MPHIRLFTRSFARFRQTLVLAAPLFWISVCIALGLGTIFYPATVYQSARRGLLIWCTTVLPSQLPFFVIAELLMSLGFVRLLGSLLEPAMRPLFNLPGSSGFVFSVSYLSGFPLCAILSSRLRKENLCSKDEGERLAAFTSNASPLFILGAVSVGMFHNPALGSLLAVIHYSSSFICGLLWRFWSHPGTSGPQSLPGLAELLRRYRHSRRQVSFGRQLGEAINHTAVTMLGIGGFITIFSVLTALLQNVGLFNLVLQLLAPLARLAHLDQSLLRSLLYGFFEITIGINQVSQSSSPLWQQLLATEALLAWNGLAIHAQVAGMMTDSDLGIGRYLITRILQVPLSVTLAYICLRLRWPSMPAVAAPGGSCSYWQGCEWSISLWVGITALLLLTAVFSKLLSYLRGHKIIIIR